ncbi:HesB/IscA family protein [Gilvimarinus polysaccharolyticus]|uniref:HesB/IscA family protein n=1 Tax=Gilvimarinus polysaccharolyticus TaxID=863921 RepID=UPI000673160C|nr:iron-sulfur cluster assembly accessory protein [Gilvimarinus polysaccharolyticus]
MSVEQFNPAQTALVEVTPAAIKHFSQQLAADKTATAVRLSVKESGCTGFMYVLDLVAKGTADDREIVLQDDVTLYVAEASENVIRGTKIDYVTEGVNRQLSFLNPNAKDHCGCGESFNVG